MLYAIKIGTVYFDLSSLDECKQSFLYCEQKFGFDGAQWEEIKNNFYYEDLGDLLESIGVNYEEFIE